jgi:hypothetical protein
MEPSVGYLAMFMVWRASWEAQPGQKRLLSHKGSCGRGHWVATTAVGTVGGAATGTMGSVDTLEVSSMDDYERREEERQDGSSMGSFNVWLLGCAL